MIKKIIALNFLLILVYSCGFSPIYSTKTDTFSLQKISLTGDKNINRIFDKRLRNFTKTLLLQNPLIFQYFLIKKKV